MKNNKGFSLIELMIVVAIIGVLAAIAVPNFQRFQAKAKQSEAKTQLSAYYTANKAFHAEWNMYFGDFRDIGYRPEGDLRYRIAGVAGAQTLPTTYTYTGGAGAGNAADGDWVSTENVCDAAKTNGCTEDANYALAGATAPTNAADSFLTVASSNIDGDADLDEWTIDQNKTFANPVSDL